MSASLWIKGGAKLLASWLLYVEVFFSPFELTNCFIERGKGTASSGEVCRDNLYFLSPLVEGAAEQFPRLRHVWLDAGYNGKGKGKDWIETTLGWTAKIVQHPPKPRYIWLPKGVEPDWEKITAQLPPPGFHVLPEPLDRGTNFLLVRPESTVEQGLRTTL